jgi:hypothetical protein
MARKGMHGKVKISNTVKLLLASKKPSLLLEHEDVRPV